MDSIFAVSSGAPPAAIAIVRLSGAAAFDAARALAGSLPPPRQARLRALRDADGRLIDRALVLLFPGPDSATGEDVVELHVHGGRAVVRAVEAALATHPGLRRAEPGEFTRRALANGRIDLTEAEGLGDLLAAETEGQRSAALAMAEGAVRRLAEGWTDRLVALAAQVEAQLDFAEEDDVALEAPPAFATEAQSLAAAMAALLATPPVERLRDGLRVVIAGPPNSGKSTLLNALAERDAAIVSPISGTTRDRIEAPVVRGGIAYVLTDTAGLLAETADPIERIGIARAEEAMRAADLVLWLGDDAPPLESMIHVHARADLDTRSVAPAGVDVAISARTGAGIVDLWSILHRRATAMLPRADAVAVNQRQRSLLAGCADNLRAAIDQPDMILFAEDLRLAMRSLDQLVGRSDVEAMLDALFTRFCLGK
ncbi:MAG: tRNA uridine-5-carboxymethylaminomethyl(34) synthesis GTPase MnmE [Sphingomonas bacterium]|uniref:tRNA uridine-5-carboxymethylaminomethyl(34) synthesis GTPase MnmE n=1 Tax=Sphingomonas bacterium TaxID=1895847 RepID=UPI0026323D13|nr:tRNA uridine-5-carboxymethylaminomethyl(34) synthesis GTPase MnmE [Sphingomonas bacterium]MDB5704329.1 tRNA uridine-5-carboxymethylaminomethyl(34) synthesis GTPase MnmE [Sphingomonas bacterium]